MKKKGKVEDGRSKYLYIKNVNNVKKINLIFSIFISH